MFDLPTKENLVSTKCSPCAHRTGVHYEEIFKPGPDGTTNFSDAIQLVANLRADDAHARQLAANALTFAQTYLTKEVMLVYLAELLKAYKELFRCVGWLID